MPSIFAQFEQLIWNVFHRPTVMDILDILIIAVLLYQLLNLVRRTRAVQVLKGVAVIIAISYFSEILGLKTLSWLFRSIINNGAVVILVLFQPEIRKALEQLGRGTKLEHHKHEMSDDERVITELTTCLLDLSRRRVGALVVIEGKTGLQDVMDTGISVDAAITAALLENIFEPNTPLHDGAVIIRDTRVASAACVLNLSDSEGISKSLGTRHRAGLGISETTDATVLIVSEETGIISMARDGKLTRYLDEEKITDILSGIYNGPGSGKNSLLNLLKRKGAKKEDE